MVKAPSATTFPEEPPPARVAPEGAKSPGTATVTARVMAFPAVPAVTAEKVTTFKAETAVTTLVKLLALSMIAAAISAAISSVVTPLTEKSSLPDVRVPETPVSATPPTVMRSPAVMGALSTSTVPEAKVSAPST